MKKKQIWRKFSPLCSLTEIREEEVEKERRRKKQVRDEEESSLEWKLKREHKGEKSDPAWDSQHAKPTSYYTATPVVVLQEAGIARQRDFHRVTFI